MPTNCLLYYITDRTAFPGDESSRGRLLLEKIREATEAGIDYIQLREKDLPTRDLELLAREAANTIRGSSQPRTQFLINSRTDVALAVRADGVHLRSDDVSPEAVRTTWTKCGAETSARPHLPRDPLIGVSCHSAVEVAHAAASAATFAVFGPVFEKNDTQPTGLDLLREACQANIPVLALGGITPANALYCLAAGAAGIAAVRLFQDNDIANVVKELRG